MNTARASLIGLCSIAIAVIWWLDTTYPQAGAWVLVGLSVSVGFLHGALDAPLLQRRFTDRRALVQALAVYLASVLFVGWWLSGVFTVALWILIAMSLWHFGEPYGRWDDLPRWSSGLSRVVVGGAPVMLPVWLAPDQLTNTLLPVVGTFALNVWRSTAMAWLLLLVIWVLICGLPRARAARYAWMELLGCTAAYLTFSPVMGFALYFGAYHAPTHIWRVRLAWVINGADAQPKLSPAVIAIGLAATLLATCLLGAGLWLLLGGTLATSADSTSALRWLIVALAALTAPHLVLISMCASFLSCKRLMT